jgi:bis(5'-nucleosidyl)-tetraphosphatase
MIKAAGIVLYREREEREYLVLQYVNSADYWGLCKGWIEEGESEEAAALRECKEETGLQEVELLQGFKEETSYHFISEGKKVHKSVVWFAGKVNDESDVRISDEHTGFMWLSLSQALAKIKHKNDAEVVRKTAAKLK